MASLSVVATCLLAVSARAQFQWAERIASAGNVPPNHGPLFGGALDSSDNVLITAWFDGTNNFGGTTLTNQSAGGADIFVAKYNSSGALQWAQRAGGTGFNNGHGIGADTNGNVYVTGGVYGPAHFGNFTLPASSYQNFFFAKYNSAGAVQWVDQSVAGYDVFGKCLAMDVSGNAYMLLDLGGVTPLTLGSNTITIPNGYGESDVLVKYDSTGTLKWAVLIGNSAGFGQVSGSGVALDAVGNVYAYGSFIASLTIGSSNVTATDKSLFTAKFSSSGALSWVVATAGGSPNPGSMAVDPTGSVYISGAYAAGSGLSFGGVSLTNGGAFLAKYNASGSIQWATQEGGPGGGGPSGVGVYVNVALDGQTNIYAAGVLNSNAVVAEYSPAGALRGIYPANAPGGFAGCAVDAFGHCYAAGLYQGTATFGATVLQPQESWNFFLTEAGTNPTPIVHFTAAPNSGAGPLAVQFTSQSLDSQGNGITSWKWNFGDGTSTNVQNPAHIYQNPGTFTPTLSATNQQNVAVIALGPQISVAGFTFITNNGTITITGYLGRGGAVAIPTNINGMAVTSIGAGAFYNYDNLASVAIPYTVTNIGLSAFAYCLNLQAITVDAANPSYSSVGGILFDKTQTALLAFPGIWGSDYAVPPGVKRIGDYAFAGCFGLTDITIPGSVTNFGQYAFQGCDSARVVLFQGDAPNANCTAFDQNVQVTIWHPSIAAGWSNTFACLPARSYLPIQAPAVTSTNGYTIATGLDGSNIVGYYYTGGGGGTHGFRYDGNSYFTLDDPDADTNGSRGTFPCGISGGNIVGYYYDSSGNAHGFLYDGTGYSTLDYPGANQTYAHGIDGTNIVGYFGYPGATHGFLYDGNSYTELDADNSAWTEAAGISGVNIVGTYYENPPYYGTRSFEFAYGYWTLPEPAGDFGGPYAFGVSGANIVGYYDGGYPYNAYNGDVCFLFDGYNYSILNVPYNPAEAIVTGISGNVIVGHSQDSSGTHSFACTVPLATYTQTVQTALAAGGSVSGGGSVFSGNWVTVTATANAGYLFVNWTVNGIDVADSASYTFTAQSNQTLVANFAPTVAYAANPTNGAAPLTVQFTAAAVDGAGNSVTSWTWDFGDGTISTARNPSHTYNSPGLYWPSLEGTNSLGAPTPGVGPPSISVAAVPAFYSFDANNGAYPYAGLLLSGGVLYGTTFMGGSADDGTVFTITTNGSGFGFAVLHNFTNGADDGLPEGGLVLSGNTLYGTASGRAIPDAGSVFSVTTNGVGFATLHRFTSTANAYDTNSDGAEPRAGLVMSGNMLFGTAVSGGVSNFGTVFALRTDGSNFTTLHAFTNGLDGVGPSAGLLLAGDTLYGTATSGGSNGTGTVFSIKTNGSGFATLTTFGDGANPQGELILAGDTLYGTTANGGSVGDGTVYSVKTNGTGFRTLYAFTGFDGFYPVGKLLLVGDSLYGSTFYGGISGFGTVFAVRTNGTDFTSYYSFGGDVDGAYPNGGLVLAGKSLYGTTQNGGFGGIGVVFALPLPSRPVPPAISLPVHYANNQFQMSVSGTAGQNYTVQMATNAASTSWSSLFVTNTASGLFLFTDPNATNRQRFYRVLMGP